MSRPEDWYWLCERTRVSADDDDDDAEEARAVVDNGRFSAKTGGGMKSDMIRGVQRRGSDEDAGRLARTWRSVRLCNCVQLPLVASARSEFLDIELLRIGR